MTTSVIYTLLTVLIVGALMIVAVQVRQLRYIKQQQLKTQQRYMDELHTPRLCRKCGKEEVATAIRRSALVQHQKRAARIRKGSQHNA